MDRRDFLKQVAATSMATAPILGVGQRSVTAAEADAQPASRAGEVVSAGATSAQKEQLLLETDFAGPAVEWDKLPEADAGGVVEAESGKTVTFSGSGVHTRNGDSIELHFCALKPDQGAIRLGFAGGMEAVSAELDLKRRRVAVSSTNWTVPQPEASGPAELDGREVHVLRLEKREGSGNRVKMADIDVVLDGRRILSARNVNVLPELPVSIGIHGTKVVLKRFAHWGAPSGIPKYLHVGAYPIPNRPSIEENLQSVFVGLQEAAAAGVQFLVTPETSLTGLFPSHTVTRDPKPVAEAERKLQRYLSKLKGAPYLVLGLPVWEHVEGHRRELTRYNASRVYDPDGGILTTGRKIHSCEGNFWHGARLNEFDVYGVPVCMHVCHDGRYPELWTLPVMFGAKLIVHPANPATPTVVVKARDKSATTTRTPSAPRNSDATSNSHAFYMYVTGGGTSSIVGPKKQRNLFASGRDEGLIDAKLHIPDAFGYWPTRSYRLSEETAAAYAALYRSMGGKRDSHA